MGGSRRKVGRAILVLFSALIAVFGLLALCEGYRIRRQTDEILYANPLSIEADLSAEGVYKGRFSGRETHCLGFAVLLEVTPAFESIDEAEEALDGLEARWQVLGNDGNVLAEQPAFIHWYIIFLRGDEKPAYPLCYLNEVPQGECTFALAVTKPASNLEGRPHRLSGRYEICGLEYLAAKCATLAGLVASLVGGVSLLLIFLKSRRHGRRAAG